MIAVTPVSGQQKGAYDGGWDPPSYAPLVPGSLEGQCRLFPAHAQGEGVGSAAGDGNTAGGGVVAGGKIGDGGIKGLVEGGPVPDLQADGIGGIERHYSTSISCVERSGPGRTAPSALRAKGWESAFPCFNRAWLPDQWQPFGAECEQPHAALRIHPFHGAHTEDGGSTG